MRKYLLPENGNFYKANLHCHTSFSDGKLSPKEVKTLYKGNGYSIVAFTDHDLFVTHDYLNDEKFLALHGYEVEITEQVNFRKAKCCHLCYIALDESNTVPVCLNRDKYMFANAPSHAAEMNFADMVDYDRSYSPECINDMIAKGKEKGFFVSYNHPTWSLENYEQYSKYKGMDALEIFNYSCLIAGYDDCNAHAYDDMLRLGCRIACTGSDDNHDAKPYGNPNNDSLGAWTMICASDLSYKSIASALEKKNYYASCGPVIKALWYEDGSIHIECAPARSIVFTTGIRNAKLVTNGAYNTVTEGSFEISPDSDDIYVRITVIGEDGTRAYTRAYFLDELI